MHKIIFGRSAIRHRDWTMTRDKETAKQFNVQRRSKIEGFICVSFAKVIGWLDATIRSAEHPPAQPSWPLSSGVPVPALPVPAFVVPAFVGFSTYFFNRRTYSDNTRSTGPAILSSPLGSKPLTLYSSVSSVRPSADCFSLIVKAPSTPICCRGPRPPSKRRATPG